jgi:hypothetical protein
VVVSTYNILKTACVWNDGGHGTEESDMGGGGAVYSFQCHMLACCNWRSYKCLNNGFRSPVFCSEISLSL